MRALRHWALANHSRPSDAEVVNVRRQHREAELVHVRDDSTPVVMHGHPTESDVARAWGERKHASPCVPWKGATIDGHPVVRVAVRRLADVLDFQLMTAVRRDEPKVSHAGPSSAAIGTKAHLLYRRLLRPKKQRLERRVVTQLYPDQACWQPAARCKLDGRGELPLLAGRG